MPTVPIWINKKALLLLHEYSLATFGGLRGLRDEGLLESALARAQNLYAYKPRTTLTHLAAATAFGLARNHPFNDGNKRAAFLSIGLFLGLNGLRLTADKVDATHSIIALADGTLDENALAAWIEANAAARN